MRRLALALALIASLAFAAPAAQAAPCSNGEDGVAPFTDDATFFDSQGFEWDFSLPPPAPTLGPDEAAASFFDAGTNPSLPGTRQPTDSYDGWGELYLGGQGVADQYHFADNNACALEDGDRELVFPLTNLHGFEVQRKIWVPQGSPATTLPGARILDIVRNPSQGAASTSIQVGLVATSDHDLGSDGATVIHHTSSGDTTVSSQDLWAVSGDNNSSPSNDYTLGHVFDGPGGADRVDFAQLDPGLAPTLRDNLAYRWDGVTLQPGETAAFLSYEIQQAVASGDEPTEAAMARDRALDYQALPFTQIYAGMTDAEIAAVRNWPHPRPTAVIAQPSNPIDEFPTVLNGAGSSPSSAAGMCQGASYQWIFGDGESAVGQQVSHLFDPGTFTVTLRVTNSCGETAETTRQVTVRNVGPACVNTILGTDAADSINGTSFGDRILGGDGNDRLSGRGGADCLRGGRGDDRENGGPGNDSVAGESGNDRLSGSTGGDKLSGKSGKDRLSGGSSKDSLSGGSGDDRLNGGSSRDSYKGGSGNDSITANDDVREKIDCGPGSRDRVVADPNDSVRNCERVTRR